MLPDFNACPRFIPLFSIALAILLTLGSSSYATPSQGAEQGRGTIAGEVTDQTGQRIPGAVVLLQPVSGQRRKTTSDARGEFAFDDVASGPYRVTAVDNQLHDPYSPRSPSRRASADE